MKDNTTEKRFEIEIDGQIALADYRIKDNIITLPHVFVPPELRGGGVAGKLMQEIVDHARKNSMKIHPVCPYAVAWMDKHKESQDLRV